MYFIVEEEKKRFRFFTGNRDSIIVVLCFNVIPI